MPAGGGGAAFVGAGAAAFANIGGNEVRGGRILTSAGRAGGEGGVMVKRWQR